IAMYTDKPGDGPRSTKGVFSGISNRAGRLWMIEMMMMTKKKRGNGRKSSLGRGLVGGWTMLLLREFLSIAQQADVANKALQDNIQKLRETHKTIVSALVKTDTHLNEALSKISSLESGLHDAEKRFVYMQELRDYISVMCDFLNDKAFLMELEENIQQLHEKRALAISERHAADLADESGVIEAAVSAAVSILSKGSSSTCLSAASNAAQAAAAAARGSSNLQPELDEFGRDINMQKRMDLKCREEDRRQRKTQSETKRLASAVKNKDIKKIEGELSTDESDSESTAYVSSRDEFLKAADHVFIDAKEEYSSLRIVKDKFEGWKAQYPSAYRDAHVALSAPSVFSPYVRLKLLKWDPLHETTDFFDMDWHKDAQDLGLSIELLPLSHPDEQFDMSPFYA
ncbi:hypothetical protein ACJX0J_042204, partial [Zea mays]